MPIGATIGAAVIGAGAGIYSSSQASKAQTHAANTAADNSLQVAQENNAFAQNMYNQNAARLDPYSTMGLAAGNEIMGLLLGPAPSASTGGTWGSPTPSTGTTGGGATGSTAGNPSLDAWANGAIAAMAPNITRSSTWQVANGITDPYQKLQYLLSQSPPDSDQYPLYQAYVAAHPQPSLTVAAPTAPATTAPTTTSGAATAQSVAPMAAAPTLAPNNALAPVAQGVQTAPVVSQTPIAANNTIAAASPTGINNGFINPALANHTSILPQAMASNDLWQQPDGPGGATQFHSDNAIVNGVGSGVFDRFNQPPATTGTPTPVPTTGGTTPTTGGTTAPNNALSAWDTFRNSTNYQFRLDQGLEGVNTKYAALGAIESGAAMKAIDEYSQNFASNELANYMDQLYRQEALGAQAASSLAGVGTTLVNQVSANNTNAADAASNAALVAGQGSANMWNSVGSNIAGAAGTIGGALASSYSQPTYDYAALQNSGVYPPGSFY